MLARERKDEKVKTVLKKWKVFCFVVVSLCVCVGIMNVKQAKAASEFVIDGGVLVEYTGNSSSVTVPGNVKKIGASAFEGNKKVTSVQLPKSVTEIKAQAFKGCTSLRTISCKDNIKLMSKHFMGVNPCPIYIFLKNCIRLETKHF